jgi:hypothetical protein
MIEMIAEEPDASFLRDRIMEKLKRIRRRRYRASTSHSSAGTGTKDRNSEWT